MSATPIETTDYEEVLEDHRRLTRELDAILSSPDEPAKQASLCDLIGLAKTVAKDAARYRFIRSQHEGTSDSIYIAGGHDLALDEYIDAAMTLKKELYGQ